MRLSSWQMSRCVFVDEESRPAARLSSLLSVTDLQSSGFDRTDVGVTALEVCARRRPAVVDHQAQIFKL